MKLRIIFVIAVTSLFIFLTGCVKGDFHITVNKSGSAELDYKLGLNSKMVALMSSNGGQDPVQELKTSFEKKGFTVSPYQEGEYIGVDAKKHLDNLKDISDTLPSQNMFGQNRGDKDSSKLDFSENKSFFFTTYRYNGSIDMTNLKPDSNDKMGIQQMMFKQFDLKLTMTLPVKADSQNASRVLSDQQTYQWDLIPGTKGDVILQAKVPNVTNIVLSGIVIIVILAAIIIVFIKSRRKKINAQNVAANEQALTAE